MSLRLVSDVVGVSYTLRCIDGHWFTVWTDGMILPVISGGEGDEGDEGDDGDEGDEDEGSDDGDEDSDDKSKKKSSTTDSSAKRASEEAKRHRLAKNAAIKERDEAKSKLKELQDAQLKDDEKKDARIKELEEQVKAHEPVVGELSSLRMFKSFVSSSADAKLVFEDPEEALLLLGNKKKYTDMIEVDDDGTITGMDEAVKALAKDKPRMLVKASGSDDDDDEDEDDKGNGSGGTKTKSANNSFKSRKKGGGNLDRAALEAKFPALRR